MGEAKRRKKILGSNYGRVYHLSNDTLRNQQAELVSSELIRYFSSELKPLMIATSFSDDYFQTTERIQQWLKFRLSQYTPKDRSFIAQFIFSLITHLKNGVVIDDFNREHSVSPLIICCFLTVIKDYIQPAHLDNLKQRFQREFDKLSQEKQAEPLSQSLIAEINRIIPANQ